MATKSCETQTIIKTVSIGVDTEDLFLNTIGINRIISLPENSPVITPPNSIRGNFSDISQGHCSRPDIEFDSFVYPTETKVSQGFEVHNIVSSNTDDISHKKSK